MLVSNALLLPRRGAYGIKNGTRGRHDGTSDSGSIHQGPSQQAHSQGGGRLEQAVAAGSAPQVKSTRLNSTQLMSTGPPPPLTAHATASSAERAITRPLTSGRAERPWYVTTWPGPLTKAAMHHDSWPTADDSCAPPPSSPMQTQQRVRGIYCQRADRVHSGAHARGTPAAHGARPATAGGGCTVAMALTVEAARAPAAAACTDHERRVAHVHACGADCGHLRSHLDLPAGDVVPSRPATVGATVGGAELTARATAEPVAAELPVAPSAADPAQATPEPAAAEASGSAELGALGAILGDDLASLLASTSVPV